MPRFALRQSVDGPPRNQPLLMLLVLVLDRAHIACRSRPQCVDLLRSTDSPFDQEINNTPLAHVALHPRRPRITTCSVDTHADTQGIQDAAQRPQGLKQVRSLGRPA